MRDWLYPGAKVVFVRKGAIRQRTFNVAGKFNFRLPEYRGIYTVRECLTEHLTTERVLYIKLHELGNASLGEREPAFPVSCFRPLTKRSTDAQVSKLKRLLNTTPADLEREGV